MQLAKTFGKRRAVLVSGGIDDHENHPRYLNDLKAFYACLVSTRYGFQADDIQVLYANGGVHEMGGNRVQTIEATQRNVEDAIGDAISGKPGELPLGADDLLVLFTSNHGSMGQYHRLNLWTPGENLQSVDLGRVLAQGKRAKHYVLAIFGQCLGWYMINQVLKNTAAGKRVVLAASKVASYALEPDHAYDAFLYHLTAALSLKTPSGYPADADTTGDGHVDFWEAFEFARKMDATPDQPDIDDGTAAQTVAKKMTLEGMLP